MKRYLVIFAREPRLGQVKTRLAAHIGKKQCLHLYQAFLKDTLTLARRVSCDGRSVAYESSGRSACWIRRQARGFFLFKQEGVDLGERLSRGFERFCGQEPALTVVIGADSPHLPLVYLRKAFAALAKADVVLGPAADGGYYLIGLKTPCPRLFSRMPWGRAQVFARTRARALKSHLRVKILPQWYDVDDLDSLQRFLQDVKDRKISGALWTRKYLKERYG